MSSSGRKAPVGAAFGLIAAGAGIAAYYYLFLHKPEKKVLFGFHHVVVLVSRKRE